MEEVRSSNLLHSTTFTKFARRGVFLCYNARVGGRNFEKLEVRDLTQWEKRYRETLEKYPELKVLSMTAYRKLRYVALQKYEPRMGYPKLGEADPKPVVQMLTDPKTGAVMLPEDVAFARGKKLIEHPRLPGNTPPVDSDHNFLLLELTDIMEECFNQYFLAIFNFQPQWHQIDKDIKGHEVDEILLGDLTDNDHARREVKARLESRLHKSWLKGFPADTVRERTERFELFQAGKLDAYALDKGIFVLAQGILKYHFGIVGNYDEKPGLYVPTPDDKGWRELTGSDRVVDNLYAHFLHNTRRLQAFRFFLIGMIEAMYEREFDNYIPETVKALY